MKKIPTGVDAKILQYEEYAINLCNKRIDLNDLIGKHLFKKPVQPGFVLVNLEKDKNRYELSLGELQKLSVNNFVHLKATYWRDKQVLETDLTEVLRELKQFNPKILGKKLVSDEFSEFNDPNIYIQDGPLACCCSHLRGLVYGYFHFNDYTAIIEDDFIVTNTEYIEKYLQCIPDDWDIVCFNSCAKNKEYNTPWYKFESDFHSTHFYIVRNSSLPKLFSYLYPITDQIDVMISDQIRQFNIYNIEDTVYQRNIATNTQNNLHVIFNSPNYAPVRATIDVIHKNCLFFANKILKNNKRNKVLVEDLIYDVIYDYILRAPTDNSGQETFEFDESKYTKYAEYDELLDEIHMFVTCARKGINSLHVARALLTVILFTLESFKLHNTFVTPQDWKREGEEPSKEKYKAYAYGATACTYRVGNTIIKSYYDKLRWTTEGHNDRDEIYRRELQILNKLYYLDCVPKVSMAAGNMIHMDYAGESLYHKFKLPKDWEQQIRKIFAEFDRMDVYYPEFRLQNILVSDGKISFVDFGLAQFGKKNEENCEKFVKWLKLLKKKFRKVKDSNLRRQLCTTFLRNI